MAMKRPRLLQGMAQGLYFDIGTFPSLCTPQEREDQERDLVNFLYQRAFDHTDTQEAVVIVQRRVADYIEEKGEAGMDVDVRVLAQAYAEYVAMLLAHFTTIKKSTNVYYVVTYHTDTYRALQACPEYMNPFRALWKALCAYVTMCMKSLLGERLDLNNPESTRWIADAIYDIHDELNCTLRLYGFGIGDGAPENIDKEAYFACFKKASEQQRKVSAYVAKPEFAHIVKTRSDWAKQPGYAVAFKHIDGMIDTGALVSRVRST